MKINPSEAARQAVPPQPTATPSEPAQPGIARDRLSVSARAATDPSAPAPGTFEWKEAGRHWWRGFIKQPVALIKGIREHPLRTLGMAAAAGAAILLVPLALPISLTAVGTALTVAFGAWGLLNIVAGGVAARQAYHGGQFDQAEQEFERIGEGSFNLASAVAPYVSRQVMKAVRTGITAEVAYAERLAAGAEVVGTKAEGLHRAAATVSQAGKAAEAESLVLAAKQLNTYQQALTQQAAALRDGQQTLQSARAAVQQATRTLHVSAPKLGVSPFRLGNSAVELTSLQKATGFAAGQLKTITANQNVAQRAQTLQKAAKAVKAGKLVKPFIATSKTLIKVVKPLIKIGKPLVGVVPDAPNTPAAAPATTPPKAKP